MHQYNSTMGVCMSHFWQEQEPRLPTNKHQTRTNKVLWFVHVVHAPAKDGDLAGGTEFECTKHQQHSFCDFLPNEVAFQGLFSWYMINTCCPAPNWWANWCDLYVFVVCSFCSFVPVCEGWKYIFPEPNFCHWTQHPPFRSLSPDLSSCGISACESKTQWRVSKSAKVQAGVYE